MAENGPWDHLAGPDHSHSRRKYRIHHGTTGEMFRFTLRHSVVFTLFTGVGTLVYAYALHSK